MISIDLDADVGERLPNEVHEDLATAYAPLGDARLSDFRTPTDGSVTSAKVSAFSDIPRYLVFAAGVWPTRPSDARITIFIGGSVSTNAPASSELRTGDVWIPAGA